MSKGDVVVHVFGKTDVGRTREHNEDSFLVADLTTGNATLQPEVRRHVVGDRGTMFMVADGMGGAAAGEIASAMATEIVSLCTSRPTYRVFLLMRPVPFVCGSASEVVQLAG